MEVIVRNLADQATEKQINKFFKDVLEKLGIKTYHFQKLKGRGCATITIHDVSRARLFLTVHGQTLPAARGYVSVQKKLHHMGREIWCMKSSNEPDEFLLLSLKKEESDRYLASQKKPKIVPARIEGTTSSTTNQRAWDISNIKCGQWTYVGTDLAFATYFQEKVHGRLIFGQRTLRVNLVLQSTSPQSHQVEVPYKTIESFTISPNAPPSVTLSLSEAPKFFEKLNLHDAQDSIKKLQASLQFMSIKPSVQQIKRKRISALGSPHEMVVGSCLCYRFLLANPNDIAGVKALKKFPMVPDSYSWSTPAILGKTFAVQMDTLKSALTGTKYGSMPFDLKFQLQKLAQNGILKPKRVAEMVGVVSHHLQQHNAAAVVQSVRNLYWQLPYAGPGTEASDLTLEAITKSLVESQDAISRGEYDSSGLADQYDHIASVQKAMVTPAGIYLSGPEPEVKNRVLRKYSAFLDYFLSVSFLDEDGEPLRLDRQTSGKDIYHGRYKKVLQSGINIAGRQYEFLGFSHSSLRSQTCWFMAPFVLDGSLVFAQSVIKNLGDFSSIRSPAKCAARIGQAFSQTLSSVTISPKAFCLIPDVERNGRTFSDGCGTCSYDVLREIWKKYAQASGLKPTVFQIRFQGAKGVISLDKRLQGSALRLRPSMIKFGGTNVADIEICGAAFKPLPMYLNRQLIKILEDLGVPPKAFLNLQADAVEQLRMTTVSAINASSFLQRNFIGKAARLPWLLRKLWAIGYSFTDDIFLRDTLELAVLIELRELKHRSRIRVQQGVTLYGIMDETGYLQEDEIYCSVHTEKGGQIIQGSVVITRSPALHPGDVRCVMAVDVPPDSPLQALHNVVVFSRHGERDLPSKLSGGDLDGDIYNIIYDDALYPKRLAQPADYPTAKPVDIGRPVERPDITDFFIRFMENDNLGLIATLHQILADRNPQGTFDPICVAVAEMHSTAVDFSKTGIPVEFARLPKYPKVRPDFQAPGPRVLIEKTIKMEEDDLDTPANEENDELEEVESYEPAKLRYYESPKVLGQLYREIDEHKFLEQIQAQSGFLSRNTGTTHSLIKAVWTYVREKAMVIQWHHCIRFAEDVKESYEENLADTMLQYSSHPSHFITEVEVFSGNILGKTGTQSKRQREFSKTMKDKHERDVEYTVHSITRGEDGKSGDEALERSIACLFVACNTVGKRKKVGVLKSFGWIAAAVCLKEVEKLPGSNVLL